MDDKLLRDRKAPTALFLSPDFYPAALKSNQSSASSPGLITQKRRKKISSCDLERCCSPSATSNDMSMVLMADRS